MTALLIGDARCSTDQQELTVQREGLLGLESILHGSTSPRSGRRQPGTSETPQVILDF